MGTLEITDLHVKLAEEDKVILDGLSLTVRTVVWYPNGDEDDPEPFVYLVIGRERRA